MSELILYSSGAKFTKSLLYKKGKNRIKEKKREMGITPLFEMETALLKKVDVSCKSKLSGSKGAVPFFYNFREI